MHITERLELIDKSSKLASAASPMAFTAILDWQGKPGCRWHLDWLHSPQGAPCPRQVPLGPSWSPSNPDLAATHQPLLSSRCKVCLGERDEPDALCSSTWPAAPNSASSATVHATSDAHTLVDAAAARAAGCPAFAAATGAATVAPPTTGAEAGMLDAMESALLDDLQAAFERQEAALTENLRASFGA